MSDRIPDKTMSRKAAPKPEELIAKLDSKFETFKEEITEVIAQRKTEIEQITANDLEIRNNVEENHKEINEKLQSSNLKLEKLLEEKMDLIKRFDILFLSSSSTWVSV